MFKKTLSAFILFGVCCAPLAAIAQQDEHHDDNARQQQQYDRHDDRGQQHQYVEHREWKRGYHMNHDDWDRGQQVDYRAYHLQRPRSGYEWREIDGHYVMANRDGVVTTVVVARH
ncbi:MAG TPA: RcnB family protein [Acidobacteriaceae bacterium]|nr:RcnB family protein [Acidobacteriaceae bacterium]